MNDIALAGYPTRVRTSKRPTAIPVIWAWAALFVNVLAFLGPRSFPFPRSSDNWSRRAASRSRWCWRSLPTVTA